MFSIPAKIMRDPEFETAVFMKSKLAKFYTDADGNFKSENDIIRRPDLASTLDKIASEGSDVFYSGDVARDIVKEVRYRKLWFLLCENFGLLELHTVTFYINT